MTVGKIHQMSIFTGTADMWMMNPTLNCEMSEIMFWEMIAMYFWHLCLDKTTSTLSPQKFWPTEPHFWGQKKKQKNILIVDQCSQNSKISQMNPVKAKCICSSVFNCAENTQILHYCSTNLNTKICVKVCLLITWTRCVQSIESETHLTQVI